MMNYRLIDFNLNLKICSDQHTGVHYISVNPCQVPTHHVSVDYHTRRSLDHCLELQRIDLGLRIVLEQPKNQSFDYYLTVIDFPQYNYKLSYIWSKQQNFTILKALLKKMSLTDNTWPPNQDLFFKRIKFKFYYQTRWV